MKPALIFKTIILCLLASLFLCSCSPKTQFKGFKDGPYSLKLSSPKNKDSKNISVEYSLTTQEGKMISGKIDDGNKVFIVKNHLDDVRLGYIECDSFTVNAIPNNLWLSCVEVVRNCNTSKLCGTGKINVRGTVSNLSNPTNTISIFDGNVYGPNSSVQNQNNSYNACFAHVGGTVRIGFAISIKETVVVVLNNVAPDKDVEVNVVLTEAEPMIGGNFDCSPTGDRGTSGGQ